MTHYRLDVDKKFGQYLMRFYEQGATPPAFGPPLADMRALVAALEARLVGVALDGGEDVVSFRNNAYVSAIALRETVRLSRY